MWNLLEKLKGRNGVKAPEGEEFKETIERDTARRKKLRRESAEARKKAEDRMDQTLSGLELATSDLKKLAEEGPPLKKDLEEETPED